MQTTWQEGGLLRGNPGMDSSIMILALPMISCMMAYRSVTRMWMICVNSKVGSLGYVEDFNGQRTWLARLVVCQNMHLERSSSLFGGQFVLDGKSNSPETQDRKVRHQFFAGRCLRVLGAFAFCRSGIADHLRLTEALGANSPQSG